MAHAAQKLGFRLTGAVGYYERFFEFLTEYRLLGNHVVNGMITDNDLEAVRIHIQTHDRNLKMLHTHGIRQGFVPVNETFFVLQTVHEILRVKYLEIIRCGLLNDKGVVGTANPLGIAGLIAHFLPCARGMREGFLLDRVHIVVPEIAHIGRCVVDAQCTEHLPFRFRAVDSIRHD